MPTLWNRLLFRLLHPQRLLRDLALWVLAAPLAYLLRFDGSISVQYRDGLEAYVLWGTLLKIVAVFIFRLYATSYRKASFRDVGVLGFAVGIVTLASLVLVALLRPEVLVPRSIPIIEGGVALLLLFAARAFGRAFDEWQRKGQAEDQRGVLIVGAGEAGNLLAREMARHPELGLKAVGFVDDDPEKQGLSLAGVKVLGNLTAIEALIQRHQIDEVIIAIPSAEGAFVRETLRKVQEAATKVNRDVQTRVIPGMYELLTGDVSLQRIREVQVEDLLRRSPVELNMQGIQEIIAGRGVWVTGAGGSIGSEITRQLLGLGAAHLLLIDQAENNLFELEQELRRLPSAPPFSTALASVQDLPKLRRSAHQYPPQLIFHAAAHKHVPIIEANPEEAILNNILGTQNIAEIALEFGTERLVNISTDKAINPTSVMGASKRVAEAVVKEAGKRALGNQRFVSVRFGNVLGSRGSVVPIFGEQISRGGPITITDKRMTRYFMTIPEASQLVLQAAAIAESERVYFLDMGEPVRIVDLAEDLIRLSGLEPYVDIDIQEVGTRPGEKLFEELSTTQAAASTSHRKIFVANGDNLGDADLGELIAELSELANKGDQAGIREALQRVVPGGMLSETAPAISG